MSREPKGGSSGGVVVLPADRGSGARSAAEALVFEPTSGCEPSGLYLHVPFCSAICPYCDFAVARGSGEDRERFVAALEREIRGWTSRGSVFDSIYLGGGTPSSLASEQLGRILAAVEETLPLAEDAAVILEANPEDVTPQRARAWRGLGVHGVSLGVQSFRSPALRFLGRRHSPHQARRSVETVLDAGFEWISLDLIYGLPAAVDASAEAVLEDVAIASDLAPHHVSCYQLTVAEGTPFARLRRRGGLREPAEEAQAEAFLAVHAALAERGYSAYEASNFARAPQHRSPHNPKYWRHAPYLGLGPSAHSFDGRERWWNARDWRRWSVQVEAGARPEAGRERLDRTQLALEHLMLRLRTAEGVDLAELARHFALDLVARNRSRVEALVESGLLVLAEGRLYPTPRGLAVADGLAAGLEVE